MAAPGSTVTSRATALPRSAPVKSSIWFVVGFALKGSLTPQTITSIDGAVTTYGDRVSYSYLYDALDVFFKEGGAKAIVSRVVGDDAALATLTLDTDSLVVNAKSVGDWGNSISVAVVAGEGEGTYRLQVLFDDEQVEESTDLTTQQDAVEWSTGSDYVDVELSTGTDPPDTAAAAPLTGGDDDHEAADEDNWTAAVGMFTKSLGPGQVSMPGRTTDEAHATLLAHAAANNRVAFLDYEDTADRATLVTSATTDRAVDGSDCAAPFGPWARVPGILTGTTRIVPYSAVQAGICARNDLNGVTQNQPSAGVVYGKSRYAIGLSQEPWSDDDRDQLNQAGFNVARVIDGTVTTYGYRTLADPASETALLLLSNRRLVMEIVDKAQAIGDTYVFRMLDGRRLAFADFDGDLQGMLEPYYNDGSLFGTTEAEAFTVDTGPTVNTIDTIAALKLKARMLLQLSPFAEKVPIEIESTALTQEVNA